MFKIEATQSRGQALVMRIKIMPDYECAPLWWDGGNPDKMGEILPKTIGLSDDLCAALWAWAATYDATLIRDDPAKSSFQTDASERAFHAQGRELAKRVAEELGQTATVRYWRDQ
jgi:hypothetical protein